MPKTVEPAVLPFPGFPFWRLFVCECWRKSMPDHAPVFPRHIEAAITIEEPIAGMVVSCRKCSTVWYYHSSGSWNRLNEANIRMNGSERLMHYTEGVANELAALDEVGRETEFDPPSKGE